MSNSATIDALTTFDQFVGQTKLVKRLKVSIMSAKNRGVRLDHVLLATNQPGAGKTTLAHIIANELGVGIVEVTADKDFGAEDVMNLSDRLNDGDILFIDEIHKLCDGRKSNAEFLLKLLEKGHLTIGGEEIVMPNITVIGATTNADKLPEPVLDRFVIRPVFERYGLDDMFKITHTFLGRYEVKIENDDLVRAIAGAARFTPRVVGSLIAAARDLHSATGEEPTPEELLDFEDTTADGLSSEHRTYLKALWANKRTNGKGETVAEAGGSALKAACHMTWGDMERMERYLVEIGFVARTPSGRALTLSGMDRVRELIEQGL